MNYGMSKEIEGNRAKFIVLGVGGGGCQAVQHVANQKITDISLVAIDADMQALNTLDLSTKCLLSKKNLGKNNAKKVEQTLVEVRQDEIHSIRSLLLGYDVAFIAVGMGGSTGTGAAPVIARLAKEAGVLTVAVVTMPFGFEGVERVQIASLGLDELLPNVNAVVVVSNEKILQECSNLSIDDVFKKADDVLWQVVQGVVEMTYSSSMIAIEFQDIANALQCGDHIMVGVGRATGKNRAIIATERAINSPLLNGLSLKNAKCLLVSIKGTQETMLLGQAYEMVETLTKLTGLQDYGILWGIVYDETMGDELQVTIIATGLE